MKNSTKFFIMPLYQIVIGAGIEIAVPNTSPHIPRHKRTNALCTQHSWKALPELITVVHRLEGRRKTGKENRMPGPRAREAAQERTSADRTRSHRTPVCKSFNWTLARLTTGGGLENGFASSPRGLRVNKTHTGIYGPSQCIISTGAINMCAHSARV